MNFQNAHMKWKDYREIDRKKNPKPFVAGSVNSNKNVQFQQEKYFKEGSLVKVKLSNQI